MEVVFRKETKINIDIEDLMKECIRKYDWWKEHLIQPCYTYQYENLEELVEERLYYSYAIDLSDYDNGRELITVITKTLMTWCLENGHLQEYSKLEQLGLREK